MLACYAVVDPVNSYDKYTTLRSMAKPCRTPLQEGSPTEYRQTAPPSDQTLVRGQGRTEDTAIKVAAINDANEHLQKTHKDSTGKIPIDYRVTAHAPEMLGRGVPGRDRGRDESMQDASDQCKFSVIM